MTDTTNGVIADPVDGSGIVKATVSTPKTFAEAMADLVLSNAEIKAELVFRLKPEMGPSDDDIEKIVKTEIDSYIENDGKGLIDRILNEGGLELGDLLGIILDRYSTNDILEELDSNSIEDYVNDHGEFSVTLR
jgi:hypothetical protein